MSEYIERETLKEMFLSNNKPLETAICSVIDAVPAADVAPVVHGEWIKKCDDGWYCVECSVCGHPPLKTAYGNADCESAFCPSCGCRMDGGEKHE